MALTEAEITRRVAQLIARHTEGIEPGELTRDTGFDALGFDSVQQVRLLATLENELGVELLTNDLTPIRTIGDLIDLVVSQTRQPA